MTSNPTKSTTGCQRCRQRKLKCDETKPICQKCTRAGYECVYRDSFDAHLRDQTEETVERAKQKWRARAQRSSQSPPSQETSRAQSSSRRDPPSRSISHAREDRISPRYSLAAALGDPNGSLEISYQDLAINRFFYDFVIHTPDSTSTKLGGHMSFLPDLYQQSAQDSALVSATLAAAYANFNGRMKTSKAPSGGRKQYGLALKLTRDALESPSDKHEDGTLLAVYLLCLYEIIQYPKHNRGFWGVHLDGVVAVVREQIQERSLGSISPICGWVARMVTWQMLIKHLRDGTPPLMPRSTWIGMWRPFTPQAKLASLQCKIAEYNAALRGVSATQDPTSIPNVKRRQQQYDELRAECDLWEAETTAIRLLDFETEAFNTVSCPAWLADIIERDGGPTAVHKYRDFVASFIWNTYRASRIQLELTRYLCSSYGSSIDTATSLATMTRLCEEICSSVYSTFTVPMIGKPEAENINDVCSFRGYMCLFPLGQVAKCMRLALATVPAMRERLAWVQILLEHFQHDLSVSASMKYGTFEAGEV